MPVNFHIQTEEGRAKAIKRFCHTTAAMAAAYVPILFYMDLAAHGCVMLIVAFAFFSSALLNTGGYPGWSRLLIIASTNFAVFYFSVLLGFKSGIHLYLYTSPLIAYLLYDFDQRKKIFLAFSAYLVTFLVIFIIHRYKLTNYSRITQETQSMLYVMNFTFSLILCFTLIFYFAFSTHAYTKMLINSNRQLEEKQEELREEIKSKNKAQEELLRTLKEKEVLLQEIHHRVKNNLAVISGLVELQNFYIKDEKASAILKESRNRIKSIAVLHEKFYETKSLDKIEIRAYVDELIYFIQLSFSNQNKEIKIHTRIDFIEFSLADALPFSLLLNELITNSYKHAFEGKDKGNIYLSLIKKGKDVVFHFKDDGNGFDYANYTKENSLGMNLVEAFSNQLKGKMTYSSKKGGGVDYTLHFKLV